LQDYLSQSWLKIILIFPTRYLGYSSILQALARSCLLLSFS
jgi:hypothetical protein